MEDVARPCPRQIPDGGKSTSELSGAFPSRLWPDAGQDGAHNTCTNTQLRCFQAHTQVQGGPQGAGAWPSGDSQTLETGQEPIGTRV